MRPYRNPNASRTSRPRRWFAATAIVASFALVAGACGNDDDGDVTDIDETIATAVDNAVTVASDAIDDVTDDVDDVQDTIGDAADDVQDSVADAADDVQDSVADAVDDSTDSSDEGPALDAARQMQAALSAMADGGQPTVANFEEAARLVPAPGTVTGIDDSDGDGTDDDAKATVEFEDDKACVQSQDAVWEVTDDEC